MGIFGRSIVLLVGLLLVTFELESSSTNGKIWGVSGANVGRDFISSTGGKEKIAGTVFGVGMSGKIECRAALDCSTIGRGLCHSINVAGSTSNMDHCSCLSQKVYSENGFCVADDGCNVCPPHSVCTPHDGDIQCTCEEGYVLEDWECVPIDPVVTTTTIVPTKVGTTTSTHAVTFTSSTTTVSKHTSSERSSMTTTSTTTTTAVMPTTQPTTTATKTVVTTPVTPTQTASPNTEVTNNPMDTPGNGPLFGSGVILLIIIVISMVVLIVLVLLTIYCIVSHRKRRKQLESIGGDSKSFSSRDNASRTHSNRTASFSFSQSIDPTDIIPIEPKRRPIA
eukprot:Nk52_evm49s296 gene=Nk52_evmTU49s296